MTSRGKESLPRRVSENQIDPVVDSFAKELRRIAGLSPQISGALHELKGIISEKYPSASYKVTFGLEDPFGLQLRPVVDLDDTEEVLDSCLDKLQEIQFQRGLPIQVFPERPEHRIIEDYKRKHGFLEAP